MEWHFCALNPLYVFNASVQYVIWYEVQNWHQMPKKKPPYISHAITMLLCEHEGFSNYQDLGAVSIRKTVLPGMAIPMLKIRRPNGRLIFNMEIAICR